jgi:TatD DNase family protein
MAPVPNRGKRNEPAFIKYIAEKQAELHEVSVDDVERITTNLAIKTFPRLES